MRPFFLAAAAAVELACIFGGKVLISGGENEPSSFWANASSVNNRSPRRPEASSIFNAAAAGAAAKDTRRSQQAPVKVRPDCALLLASSPAPRRVTITPHGLAADDDDDERYK